jgi:hypothetical protein
VKPSKKFGMSNAVDGTEDDVLSEESESSGNDSNDACVISKDFMGIYYQWIFHTALLSVTLSFKCE